MLHSQARPSTLARFHSISQQLRVLEIISPLLWADNTSCFPSCCNLQITATPQLCCAVMCDLCCDKHDGRTDGHDITQVFQLSFSTTSHSSKFQIQHLTPVTKCGSGKKEGEKKRGMRRTRVTAIRIVIIIHFDSSTGALG